MNFHKKLLLLPLLMSACVAVHASDFSPSASGLTRDEVKTQAMGTRPADELYEGNREATQFVASRSQVKAELAQAFASGEMRRSVESYPVAAAFPSTLTRKTVRESVVTFLKSHTLPDEGFAGG